MHWNHRLFKQPSAKFERDNGQKWYYTIRETYYTDGKVSSFSAEPRGICGDSIKDVSEILDWMKNCLDKPVIELDEKGDLKHEC